jgi:tRNA pseudouridine38-40 synthase
MKKACKVLEGRHDFLNFSKREKEEINTIRDMKLADFNKEGQFLIFTFKSQAFLRQQIRRMIAKILEVGIGTLTIKEFTSLLNVEKFISYQPADPTGLILWDILYDNNINFTIDTKSYERMMIYFSRQYEKFSLKKKLFSILQHHDIS